MIEKFIKSKTFRIVVYAWTLFFVQCILNFEWAVFIGISTILANLKHKYL